MLLNYMYLTAMLNPQVPYRQKTGISGTILLNVDWYAWNLAEICCWREYICGLNLTTAGAWAAPNQTTRHIPQISILSIAITHKSLGSGLRSYCETFWKFPTWAQP